MTLNRIVSGVVAGIYVIYAFTHFAPHNALKIAFGLLIPLLCIWFSEVVGSAMWLSRRITAPSPPVLVCILGWLVLLIPLLLWTVYVVSNRA